MNRPNNNPTRRQAVFLQKLTEAKDQLMAAIAGLDEATLCQEAVMDDWSVKDILGHIVSWNEEFRANIATILGGEHPGDDHVINGKDHFEAWNRGWIDEKRESSLVEILADVGRDYQEAVALIGELSADDYSKKGVTPWKAVAEKRPDELNEENLDSVETLVTFHWRHMNQHVAEIEKWRKRRVKQQGEIGNPGIRSG